MKNFKLLGVIALAAVIVFSMTGCDNGTTTQPTTPPPVPQSVTYVSEDSNGNLYTLVVTENTNRSARYAARNGDSFTFTVELFSNGAYSLALTYSGTVDSAESSGTAVEININVNNAPLTITIIGNQMTLISGTVVLDNEEEITITEPLSPIDKTALGTVISAANAAKEGVDVSVNGADISTTAHWVTQGQMDSFILAIATAQAFYDAEDADQSMVNSARITLAAATTVFNGQKRLGTKSGAIAVTGVSLNKAAATLTVGGTETLTATVAPPDATNKAVTWASDNTAVVTVNNGTITAVVAGTANITVTTADGGKTATCAVTVQAAIPNTIAVTGVTLNESTLALTVGGTETLTATVAPPNATNKNIAWVSSDTAVATVSADGLITAVDAGTVTITVTTADGGKTAECSVTVTVPVTGVTLNKTTLALSTGGTETLTATIAPSDASNKNAAWASSKPDVATVSADGLVTAVGAGTANITVTTEDGGKTAECAVTVTVAVTGVTLNKSTLTLDIGDEETLIATVAPANAANKRVTWTSSKPDVATVTGGKVSAVDAGTTTITVTTQDGGKTATCNVRVRAPAPGNPSNPSNPPIAVTGVTLNRTALTLAVGGTETLTATVAPSNATNKSVTWASSNTAVATVSNGTVTGVTTGTATITVTTANGKTATCVVTVKNVTVEYYWVDQHDNLVTTSGGAATVAPGDTLTITAQGTGYTVRHWYLNGVDTGQSGSTYDFSSGITGKHTVDLFVDKAGKLYNTGITITVQE